MDEAVIRNWHVNCSFHNSLWWSESIWAVSVDLRVSARTRDICIRRSGGLICWDTIKHEENRAHHRSLTDTWNCDRSDLHGVQICPSSEKRPQLTLWLNKTRGGWGTFTQLQSNDPLLCSNGNIKRNQQVPHSWSSIWVNRDSKSISQNCPHAWTRVVCR